MQRSKVHQFLNNIHVTYNNFHYFFMLLFHGNVNMLHIKKCASVFRMRNNLMVNCRFIIIIFIFVRCKFAKALICYILKEIGRKQIIKKLFFI